MFGGTTWRRFVHVFGRHDVATGPFQIQSKERDKRIVSWHRGAVFDCNMANPMAAYCSGSIYTGNFAIKRDFVHGRLHRADRVPDVSAHH